MSENPAAPLAAQSTAAQSTAAQPTAAAQSTAAPAPKWRPLSSVERRIAGVLVEKAKTTPDAYPMTLNALVTGCNQKNNREPQMSLTPDAVEAGLESLRLAGAVSEIQGAGRVSKYRHFLYEWLGVEKYEMAVMAELLLRGEQTVGELRGRAARMEAIPGMDELRPILKSLLAKNLILALTPEGRGQVVSHNLYKERELKEIKAHYANQAAAAPASIADEGEEATFTPAVKTAATGAPAQSKAPTAAPAGSVAYARAEEVESLRREIALMRAELAAVQDEISRLKG